MFNFFKKTAKATEVSTIETITAIHNEFDTAGEKLLKEAKEILSNKVDTSKGERLKKLGFSNAKSVSEATEKIRLKKENEEIAERIEYFSVYYPNNKFITESAVKTICEKYNLVCGESFSYIGDIPEKNLSEIESFKLREEDMEVRTNVDDWYQSRMWGLMAQSIDRFSPMSNIGSIGIGSPFNQRQAPPRDLSQPPTTIIERKTKQSLKICAPEKDFNTSFMRKEGYKLIPDPIVLQPVKGGYLIISKWGLEATDELVVNQKMN